MKSTRTIIGIVASVFVLLHITTIPLVILSEEAQPTLSWWIGKVVAMILGLAVAVWALRKPAPEQQP